MINREHDAELGITRVVPGKSEIDLAAEFHDRALKDLEPLIETINAARQHGLIIQFQIAPPDGFGRQSLAMLEIIKKLC